MFCLSILCLGAATARAEIWVPVPGTTFEWILQDYDGTIPSAKAVDVDLFDTSKAKVAALKAAGRKPICYVSVGTWENWRPDKDDFPSQVIGRPVDGWRGERWLDIRYTTLLGPVLLARLDLCHSKGFIAVEPDNLDGFQANTGFNITRTDQVRYLKWLANKAHRKGLSIGLKNVPELLPDVITRFDWARTEDCFDQRWCVEMVPFIAAGKAVFAVEYTDTGNSFTKFCSQATNLGLSQLLKKRSLRPWATTC